MARQKKAPRPQPERPYNWSILLDRRIRHNRVRYWDADYMDLNFRWFHSIAVHVSLLPEINSVPAFFADNGLAAYGVVAANKDGDPINFHDMDGDVVYVGSYDLTKIEALHLRYG